MHKMQSMNSLNFYVKSAKINCTATTTAQEIELHQTHWISYGIYFERLNTRFSQSVTVDIHDE